MRWWPLRVAPFIAHQTEVVVRLGVARLAGRGLLDEPGGPIDLADLVVSATDQKGVVHSCKGPRERGR